MKTPNPDLMLHFQTDIVYAEKLAGLAPFAVRAAMGLLNMERGQRESADEHELQRAAHEMNLQLALARALLMRPVEDHAYHTRVPVALRAGQSSGFGGMDQELDLPSSMQRGPHMMRGSDVPVGFDEGMVRMASVMGRTLAHVDLDAMQKEALPSMASMGQSVQRAVRGVASKVQGAVQGSWGAQGTPSVPGASTVKAPVPSGSPWAGGPKPATPSPTLGQGGSLAPAGGSPKPMSAYREPLSGGSPALQAADLPSSHGPPSPLPAPSLPPQTPPEPFDIGKKLQEGWDRSGLSNGRLLPKAMALGGAGLAMYGAYRGAKALAGAAGQESAPYQYNQGGASPAFGVNQYGVPDRGTSLMG